MTRALVGGKLFPNNKYGTMATEDMVDAVYGNSSDGSGVYGGVARALRAFDDLRADASKAVLPLSLGAFFFKNMWWDYDGLDSARDAFERFYRGRFPEPHSAPAGFVPVPGTARRLEDASNHRL